MAGILDITSAFILFGLKGATPVRILQSIASGLLGPASFNGGAATAILGGILHFVIAFGAASTFYLASRRLRLLTQRPVISGLVFGVVVYAFMRLIVVPLSLVKARQPPLSEIVAQLFVHMLLIGLPIAFIVRYFSAKRPRLA